MKLKSNTSSRPEIQTNTLRLDLCSLNIHGQEFIMQVSLVCTDHRGGVSRNTEDRLNRQNANSPNTGTRSKFRAVAMVARSLGQLSVQSMPSSSEQSMKTGMKYR